MEIKAIQKFIVFSPKKLREVAHLLKDLTPSEAVEKLPFVGKKAANPILKVIKTAIANAKQKGLKTDTLYFKEVQIQEGPRLKRGRAGARGRVKPYKRRMSHIKIVLATRTSKGESKQKPFPSSGLKKIVDVKNQKDKSRRVKKKSLKK